MQERDERCRWNWTAGHWGLQPSNNTQMHSTQTEKQSPYSVSKHTVLALRFEAVFATKNPKNI